MILSRDTGLALLAIVAAAPKFASALDPDICATFNTATMQKFTSNLQTNGLCHDHCYGDYAFSITQGYDCWCSNYAPAQSDTVPLSDCNFPCYGFPSEPCGGANGAFSYVRLRNINVSGTKAADQASSTTSSPASTQDTSSVQTSSTAVRTVTADGIVKTVFIGPTGAPNDGSSTDRANGEVVNGNDNSDGVSKGALAGIIVGVAVGVIVLVGAGLWFFFNRRRNQQQEDDYQEDPSIRGSSSGMMGSGQRPEMSMGGGSPGSPNTSSNRNSALMVDPRMDPFKQGLYVRSHSHESINTLRDDHDYSRRIQGRTLRATNPDPEIDG